MQSTLMGAVPPGSDPNKIVYELRGDKNELLGVFNNFSNATAARRANAKQYPNSKIVSTYLTAINKPYLKD